MYLICTYANFPYSPVNGPTLALSYLLVGGGWNAADKHLGASAVVAKGDLLRKSRLWNCSFGFNLPPIDGMQVVAYTVDDQGVLEDDEAESSVCSTLTHLWSLFSVFWAFQVFIMQKRPK